MGLRQIRYCDISGVEGDVDQHEIHIDQMRIEIDLSAAEYRKLLDVLRPYIDAGAVEASAPGMALPATAKATRRSRSKKVTAVASAAQRPVGERREVADARPSVLSAEQRQQVREWAVARGIEVPANNRFKGSLVEAWREETGGS